MCLQKVQVTHIPLNTMRKLCISYLKVSHIYIITFCKVMTLSTKKAKIFSALPAKYREDHSFFFFFAMRVIKVMKLVSWKIYQEKFDAIQKKEKTLAENSLSD